MQVIIKYHMNRREFLIKTTFRILPIIAGIMLCKNKVFAAQQNIVDCQAQCKASCRNICQLGCKYSCAVGCDGKCIGTCRGTCQNTVKLEIDSLTNKPDTIKAKI